MFFKIYNNNMPKALFTARLKRYAKQTILLYQYGATEVKINELCIDKYNIPLKLLCLKLIKDAKVYFSTDGYAIIRFRDKKQDKMAQLVTYGNGFVIGSAILQNAFLRG